MRTKLLSTCLALLLVASSPSLFADSIAYFTAVQPLDQNSGPTHVDQIVTFSLPQGAPVQGDTDGVNFFIQTSATVHIADTTAAGPPLHDADVFAVIQFFNDGVMINPQTMLGFQFFSFTNAPLGNFFIGPVTSPTFVPGFYPSIVPTAGYSLTIATVAVPEPATITTIGTSLLGLLSLRRRRAPHL